jgi:signal peptidase II
MNSSDMTQAPDSTSGEKASWRERSIMLIVAALVLILDQATKFAVEATIPFNTSWMPITGLAPFFQLTHIGNTGATFGLFAGGGFIFTTIALLVVIGLLVYNYLLPAGNTRLRLVLGLLMGGAIGNNLLDRLRLGHVTDFLDFGPWPVFNVADMAIVSGAILLGWMMWQESKEEKAALTAQAEQVDE